MAGLYRPSYTKDGVKRKTAKWYGLVRGPDGKTRRVPLSEDKAIAQQMLARLVRDAEAGKHGLTDPYAPHRGRPLTEHIADYAKDQANRGVSDSQVSLVAGRLRKLFGLAKAEWLADLTPARIQAGLAALKADGRGVQTVNFYLTAAKSFCKWLVREDRLERFPLASLKAGNVATDRRHDRAVFTADELSRLIGAAREGPESHGLSGSDRAVLYLLAAHTGLRAKELRSLTPESFDLVGMTVTVLAGYSKNGQQAVQPLHPEIIPAVSAWLASKTARRAVLRSPRDGDYWWRKAARMIKADLESAGVPARDEQGRYRDFHALRHTYVTWLTRGLAPKLAQGLARHSTITLTMDRYAHVEDAERAEALAGLHPLARGLSGEAGKMGVEVSGGDGDAVEPTNALRRLRFSRPVQSTALPSLQIRAHHHTEREKNAEDGPRDTDRQQASEVRLASGLLAWLL